MCRAIPVSSDGPVSLDGPTFRANVAAIRVRQPDLADRLTGVCVPADARVVTGRDGTRTIQVSATDKTVAWLGGSSMPSVSASAVLTDFADKGTSAILPTIGTGYEQRVLAGKIGKTCSVFVYEPDTTHIAMVLSVVDLEKDDSGEMGFIRLCRGG